MRQHVKCTECFAGRVDCAECEGTGLLLVTRSYPCTVGRIQYLREAACPDCEKGSNPCEVCDECGFYVPEDGEESTDAA